MRHPVFLIGAAGVASFGLATGVLAWSAHDKPVLHLDVTFSRSACCSWQVWVNGTTTPQITVLTMQSGVEATYDVPLFTSHVEHLRMPAGQTPGGVIAIHRIWVTRGSQIVDEVDPKTLSITAYFATKQPVARGVAYRATTSGPFLDVPIDLPTGEGSPRLFLAHVESTPLRTFAALLVAGMLAMVALALPTRRHWPVGAALALTLVGVRALPLISYHLPLRDSVSQAVSFASYQGLWKTRERFVFDAAVLLALALPALVYAAVRRARRAQQTEQGLADDPVEIMRSSWPKALALIGAPSLIVALDAMPNLRLLAGGGPAQYSPSWDANNLVFWHYLIAKIHLNPMRDFFWPYGFQWLYDKPVPWGDVMSYVSYLSIWVYLAIGTYFTLARFFTGRGLIVRYVILAAFWVTAVIGGYTLFQTRYVAPLAVVLLYTSIESSARFLSWRRLLFGFALTELVLFEVAQAVYALVPIAFLLLVGIVLDGPRTRRGVAGGLVRAVATVGAPLGAATLVFIATGELGGNADYYEQLSALTATYGFPGQVDGWVMHPTTIDGVLFWSVPLALVVGAYGFLARRGRLRARYSIVLALGFLSVMIMQKQVLRPGIAPQIWLPVIFPLAFLAAVDGQFAPIRRWGIVASTAGAMAAVVLVAGGYHAGWNSVSDAPGRLSDSVGALLHDKSGFAVTARNSYVPAAFARFTAYQPVVRALQTVPEVRAGSPVWILGDDSPITMMLGHSWPYYFSDFYDASPIAFQKKILRGLKRTPPVRVVWNFAPQTMTFDTVPNVVRSPLLFEWAMTHLEPERTIGNFAILRTRKAGEPVQLAWWRQRIGQSVDLGHIPVVANLPGAACAPDTECGSYLLVAVPAARPIPPAFDIGARVRGLAFRVKFAATPGVRRYVVPLERLWFWTADSSTEPRTVQTGDAGGAVITQVYRRRDPNTLY